MIITGCVAAQKKFLNTKSSNALSSKTDKWSLGLIKDEP